MGKKIVVLTGSPRKGGNSFAMTDAFIKAAEAKGHTVTRFDTASKPEKPAVLMTISTPWRPPSRKPTPWSSLCLFTGTVFQRS